MSHEVETMAYAKFSDRDIPWHGLGTSVDHLMTSKEALHLANLDWEVVPQPSFIKVGDNFVEIPNTLANVRNSDNKVLGITSEKYKIVQNHEAFEFTDNLIGAGAKFDTAGSLYGGKKVWLLAKLEEMDVLGDKYVPYIAFINSHDGKGSVRISTVTTRIVCQNTMNIALRGASRSWTTRHMGNLTTKMAEAHRTLDLATKYNDQFKIEADRLAKQKMTDNEFTAFIESLIPNKDDATDRLKRNIESLQEGLRITYYQAPDLENFRGTKWGVLGAVTDFATHKQPLRSSDTYQERLFDEVLNGHNIIDRAYELLSA